MATNNFYKENASSYFIIDFVTDEERDLDFFKEHLYNNSNLYDGVNFLGLDVMVDIIPIIRHGYYEGANLDWRIEIDIDGRKFDDVPDVEDCEWIIKDALLNAGLARIHAVNLHNKISAIAEYLIEGFEHECRKISTEYVAIATASNGETFYQKIQ